MQERIDKANEAISEEQKKAEQRMRMSNARAALQSRGRYQRENAELGAPLDFADFVMRAIATGGVRFIWGNNPRTGTRGLGSHTGFGEQERRKRIGILSNSGLYPEVAAEQLLSSYADEIGYDPNIDTSDALSTILDIVMSYTTPKDMMEAAQARHAEVAAKEAEAAEIDAEEAYYRMMAAEHNMTVWEYMDMEAAYEELKNKDLEARDAVKEEIDAIFVEQYLEEDYDNERRNKDLYQGVSGQARSGASNEGGSNVLPSAQSDNTRAAQRSAEGQGTTAQVGIEGSDNLSASQTLGEPKSVKEAGSTPQMRAGEGAQPAGKKLSRAMNMLRIPLRKRINMWSKKVDVPVVMVEDFGDVTSNSARANILAAQRRKRRVTGWVEDGKVYFYMPMLRDIDEIDETYIHEVVAHKGMDAMLGKEEYRKFCLDVFDQVMTEADRKTYLNYEGVSDLKDETEKKAKAADEYIAHLSEGVNLTKREATLWNKIVDLFRKMLESLGYPQNISKLNIEDMIRKSYRNLVEKKYNAQTSGDTQYRVTPATDAMYMDAVERGDMAMAQRMVQEAAEHAGYMPDTSYQGSLAFNGAAPTINAYFETKEECKQAWDNDEFDDTMSLGDYADNGIDTNDLEWRLTDPGNYRRATQYEKESIDNINKALKNPEHKITIYRAIPNSVEEGSIRNGDWVTPSRSYAEYHIGLQEWDGGRIIEQEVSLDDIWWDGNDINEWGYDDGSNYGYRNTDNNRKLLDAVTYDDNGNVIPLSERFNNKKNDIRFRVSPIEGYTAEEVIDIITPEIENILNENGVDNAAIAEVWLHGSRMRGDAKRNSDLDAVLFYKGDAREDDLFNIIADNAITIDGVKVDVNPIRIESDEDITRYKQKSQQYDAEKLSQVKSDTRFRVANDIVAEQKQIIAEAKANGTYLKAPNGEPTNLTPRQWVMVRTKAFKKWFGDWEKAARIEKLRNSETISISAKDYNGYTLDRDSAKEWLKKMYEVNIKMPIQGSKYQ